jgi:hypothetical protein
MTTAGGRTRALDLATTLLDDHPRLAVLDARSLVGPANAEDPLNATLELAPLGRDDDLPGPTVVGSLACSAVVRREAFLVAGGFHPRFGVGVRRSCLHWTCSLPDGGWLMCPMSSPTTIPRLQDPGRGVRPR